LESGITPAFTLTTSHWYRKSEQGTRTGFWFSCNGLSQAIGAFIAYGLAKADLSGNLSIPSYQVIFILLGTITSAMGIVLLFFLPDSPLNARFLTPYEKEMAVERVRGNQQAIENHEYKMYQVKEAFLDPMVSDMVLVLLIDRLDSISYDPKQTWLYSLYAIALSIPNVR
jgi:MFS transporter, ACS family, allantoate permease